MGSYEYRFGRFCIIGLSARRTRRRYRWRGHWRELHFNGQLVRSDAKILIPRHRYRGLREDIEALGVRIEAFTLEDAECAARLWSISRPLGLSLGDRACLAFGMRRQIPVLTADRAWLNLAAALNLEIQGIR